MGQPKEIIADVKQVSGNPDHWLKEARNATVFVRRDGANDIVMMSIAEYDRLKRQDRQAFLASEMPEEDLADMMRDDDLHLDDDALKDEDKEWKL